MRPCYLSREITGSEACVRHTVTSIGMSGVVYPAAEVPWRALGQGATVLHINPMRFEISRDDKERLPPLCAHC